ncbi:MAG: EcoRV family type II restriction endonuclease [Deferribacteraceae bacterium]|nr:EcoRV family type II restriction endonuclease [Deferribacteraceae bacterium]
MNKTVFENEFSQFCKELQKYVSDNAGEWAVKGFIDVNQKIFTISSDTKIVSKILEIHIFPKIIEFADKLGFDIVLTDHQNYYPDMSFVYRKNKKIKYAVDIKTTYVNPTRPDYCNGFTLGSHGEYFINRESKKNIQFPYNDWMNYGKITITDETGKTKKITKLGNFLKYRGIK